MRPFTVRVNSQIRGLTSIRKGLREDDTPVLVSSNCIIASENVSGRVSGENLENPRESIFTKPEGSQSGGVPILPIRRAPNFANREWSYICQSGGVQILPIRRGPFLPIRRGPIFANPEWSCFYQSGGVLFLSTRRGIVLSRPKKTTEKKVVKGIRLIGDRLGSSDCTGNLPFIKNQAKTKQI